ncbi:MAG: aspartate aminotransferase family protein [Candidatus Helarchaeota archaeon]
MELENQYSGWVGRRPIQIVSGKGALVYDAEGKEYIDCIGGNGVAITGHSHPKIVQAIKNQAEKLIVCPTILYNEVRGQLYKRLAEVTPPGLTKSFLGNSGAEAVEAALKLARRHTGKIEIIAMKNGFHGRTMGALSVTWNPKYRKPFQPLIPGISHVPFGNVEAVTNAITKQTAAVIVEPIQGEAGVIIPSNTYLKELREICNAHDVLLIFDEVQTGWGRTGKLFAGHGHWDVIPDIMTLSKAIAGGIPMGAMIAKNEIFDSLKTGEHFSTFGGNPLSCAAALASIDVIQNEKLVEKSAENGAYLLEQLRSHLKGKKTIREIRGKGLFIAIEMKFKVVPILKRAISEGVLLLTSGLNTIRMLPPLVISRKQIDQVVNVLEKIIE